MQLADRLTCLSIQTSLCESLTKGAGVEPFNRQTQIGTETLPNILPEKSHIPKPSDKSPNLRKMKELAQTKRLNRHFNVATPLTVEIDIKSGEVK